MTQIAPGFAWHLQQDSPDRLAEALKTYHKFSGMEGYNSVRIQNTPLTAGLFCDILLAPDGGKQLTRHLLKGGGVADE
jgi:hypothetical protein